MKILLAILLLYAIAGFPAWVSAETLPPGVLTSHPRSFTIDGLAFSPDGQTLAYCSNPDAVDHQNVYVLRLSAPDQPRQITQGKRWDSYPCFAPDGRTIAFSSSSGRGTQTIYTVPVTGGTPSLLPGQGDELTWCPGYFADGQRIAYASSTRGIVVQQLTGEPVRIIPLKMTWALDLEPSPSGDQIAYRATKFTLKLNRVEGPYVNISVVDLSTGRTTPVTGWAALGQGDWAVRWVPHSTDLIILTRRNTGSIYSNFFRVPAAGGTLSPLGGNPHPQLARFAVSARGNILAFVRPDKTRVPQIWLMDLAGGHLRQLTHFERPSWSKSLQVKPPVLPNLQLQPIH